MLTALVIKWLEFYLYRPMQTSYMYICLLCYKKCLLTLDKVFDLLWKSVIILL